MTMKLVKPFARRIKGSKAGRKRPLPSSGDGKGKAKAGGGGALNGSGGGGGSVVTALTATTAESAAVAAAAAAAAAAASTQARRRRPVAKEEEGDGDVDEGGSVGAVVSVAGGIGPAHLAKADGGKREEQEDPDRPKSVVSRRRRRSRKAPPASKDQGQEEEGRSQGQEGRSLLPASASASDAGPGDGSSQPPPSPAAVPTSPASSTESPVHFSRDAVLPGPQTLEVHGEEAVPLVYDFWESYVLPHRRSSFANRSYHAADRDGVTIASVVYGEGRKSALGKNKKQASKASVTSFATTVRVSNAAADASGRRREAFLMDLNGDGKGWAGGADDNGKKSIGLLINDSGGWEGSHRSSSGNVSGPERPSLSDPYPYWMWPTSRSDLFSNPWTAEEEEYWGKTGGIGVRAVLGMSSSSSSHASGSSAGSSRGRRRHKHKRNSSHGSFSSASTASTKSRGKMDSHFGGDAMSASVDDESALFANPHPLRQPRQQRPKHRRQPPHKQPQAQAAEAQAPPGSHHPQASAALLAQRRMMERRRAQRKQRAAKQRPAPPPGAAMAGHPGVGGRRGGPGAGYATPASSVRDLLWNIPENRGAEEEQDDGRNAIPASALNRSSTPVSRLIASVIQQEQELDGTLNTPPLEGLSSNEEHTKEGESKSSVTESEEPLEVVKDPRNRPDADQPNDPGEHAAPPPAPHVQQVPAVHHPHQHQQQMHQMHIPVELQMQPQQMPVEVAMQQLEMERQMHMQMQLMLVEGGLGGAPQVPHLAGAPPSGYAVDAPLGPRAHHNGHQDVEGEGQAEGEDEPPRNMIDPAVFRAVLRSKLAASTGVFDWNAGPSSRRVLMEEVVVPDDATEVSGDVTLPVCLMDEEDWENERRRRGFPGQIDVGGGEAGTMARTADGSGRISALTGVGNGDAVGGGGGDEVSALAEPPAGPVMPQAQPGGWSNPMMTSTTALQAFGRGESRWEVRGTGNASSTMPPHDIREGPADGGVGKMGTVEDEIVVGSQREVGVAEDLGAGAVVVGEVREEKAQEEEEDGPGDAADAGADAEENAAVKNPAVEKEEEEEAATESQATNAILPTSTDEAQTSVGSIVLRASSSEPVDTPPGSPAPPRAAAAVTASEASEEGADAFEDAGAEAVDPAVAVEEASKDDHEEGDEGEMDETPSFDLGVPSAFKQELAAAAEAFAKKAPSAEEEDEDEEERSIEISIGFPNQEDADAGEDEKKEEEDSVLELAAAAAASAAKAAAACSPQEEETEEANLEAEEAPGAPSTVSAPQEKTTTEDVVNQDSPRSDADVLRLLGMVSHSPTAAAPVFHKHLPEEEEEEEEEDRADAEVVYGALEEEGDADDVVSVESESDWGTDDGDHTTLDEDSSSLLQGPRPPAHEEMHGGSVFAAYASGALSLRSSSSMEESSMSADEDERSELRAAASSPVEVLETVDERSEHEASEESSSVADPVAAEVQEYPPSPVKERPWDQYIIPAAASGGASHSSASTSNNTPPSLSTSRSPPRPDGGSEAGDAASLNSGRSGTLSQTSSGRSILSQASSAQIMAVLSGVVDSESEAGDSLIFEVDPIEEETEDEDGGEEEEQYVRPAPASKNDGDAPSVGSLSGGEVIEASDAESESASSRASTLVDHIGELLGRAKARETEPAHKAIEEEKGEQEDADETELLPEAATSEIAASSSAQDSSGSEIPSYFGRRAAEGGSAAAPGNGRPATLTAAALSSSNTSSNSSSSTPEQEQDRFRSSRKKVKWIDFGESSLPDHNASGVPYKRSGGGAGSVMSAGGSSCGARTAETESITRPSEDESSAGGFGRRGNGRSYASLQAPDSPVSARSAASSRSRVLQERRIRDSIQSIEMSFSEDEGEQSGYDHDNYPESDASSVNSSCMLSDSEGMMVNDMIAKLKEESVRRRERLRRKGGGDHHVRGNKTLEGGRPKLDRMGSF